MKVLDKNVFNEDLINKIFTSKEGLEYPISIMGRVVEYFDNEEKRNAHLGEFGFAEKPRLKAAYLKNWYEKLKKSNFSLMNEFRVKLLIWFIENHQIGIELKHKISSKQNLFWKVKVLRFLTEEKTYLNRKKFVIFKSKKFKDYEKAFDEALDHAFDFLTITYEI